MKVEITKEKCYNPSKLKWHFKFIGLRAGDKMYINRHLENQILAASEKYPVVMLTGQRQVGKSTMLYHIKDESRNYVSLDDINARRLAETDLALFFETYKAPLIIDEFQRIPELTLEIKKIVDERALKGEPNEGMYWLTGSQRFTMMKNVSETLAGRVAIFEMSSLTSSEIRGDKASLFNPDIDALKLKKIGENSDLQGIYKSIFYGGMPKLIANDVERDRYYSDFVNTYIEKDVRDFAKIGKLREFSDFVVYMAARTGQELKYTDIANNIGISVVTAKEWVSILEQSGIIYILRPYYNNITKRLVKTPKVYFMDTGLCAYLCRWSSPEVLESGAMDGAFLETYVVTEIIKSYYNAGKQPDIYYYRDIDKKEVDLLIMKDRYCYPIEIKKSKNPVNAGKNFESLIKLNLKLKPALIMCMANEIIPYSREVYYCPIGVL